MHKFETRENSSMVELKKSVISLTLFAALAACNSSSNVEPSPIVDFDTAYSGKTALPAPGATGSITEIVRQIEDREDAYLKVIEESRTNGMIGGAIRGALLGFLMDQSGTAVASGLVIGGVIGAGIGEQFGTKIVQEHSNYIVRRDSLQRVIHAAKMDTNNTRFDLVLSDELTSAALQNDTTSSDTVTRAASSLEDFRVYALERSITLREVIPLYEDHGRVQAQLLKELETQDALISAYEKNIHTLIKREQ